MYIGDDYLVRTIREKDGSVTYILMEKMRQGMWREKDIVTTDNSEVAYLRFCKKAGKVMT